MVVTVVVVFSVTVGTRFAAVRCTVRLTTRRGVVARAVDVAATFVVSVVTVTGCGAGVAAAAAHRFLRW